MMRHNCTTCRYSYHVASPHDIRGWHYCRRYPPAVSIFPTPGGQYATVQGSPRVDEAGLCGEYISADHDETEFIDAMTEMKTGAS